MKINPSKLRAAREAAGLSRDRLSRLIGLSVTSQWRIEDGRQMPGADVLGAWARACDVSVDSLYDVDAPSAEAS